MKRKLLRSEQGFTLVELMIVVVIMAVLVAVAIPVYNAVTDNVEAQACHSNCEVIEKAAMQYVLMLQDDTADALAPLGSPVVIESAEEAQQKLPPEFLKLFQDGQFPECPSEDCTYTITQVETAGGGISVTVTCSQHGSRLGN